MNREIHLGLDLNEEPMEGDDIDDQPTPIVKLPQAHEMPMATAIKSKLPSEFLVINVMNMRFFRDK